MGHIMAVSGLLAEQAVSDHFGGKKPLGDCSCSAISLSVRNFSTLFRFVPSFLTAYVLPQSLLPSLVCLPPFHPLLSFFHCLPAAFPGRSLQYFTELCVSVAQSVGICGALPVQSVIFPLFLLCFGGLIPFSHCISTC